MVSKADIMNGPSKNKNGIDKTIFFGASNMSYRYIWSDHILKDVIVFIITHKASE